MKIEKYRISPGWYIAEGLGIIGLGKSLSEALDRWFEKYYWAHDLERK